MGLVGIREMVFGYSSGMRWWVPCLDLCVQDKGQVANDLEIILLSVNTSQEGLD